MPRPAQEPRKPPPHQVVHRCAALVSLALTALLVVPAPAGGFWGPGSLDGVWRVARGEVSYRVRHFMHDAQGVSRQVSGSAHCVAPLCTLALRVPVSSFISADPDRDRDMQAAVGAAAHPLVTVQGELQLASAEGGAALLTVSLAGTTRRLAGIPVQVDRSRNAARVSTRFPISLAAFGIAAPALLGIPIRDEVRIEVDLHLHRD